jgi:SM-20-related protein
MAMQSGGDWQRAAADLTEQGFAVLPDALPESGWQALRAEAQDLLSRAAFSAARIGRGDDGRQDSGTRGGSVCWLDPDMPAGGTFLRLMDDLRVSLNRTLFLGLDTFEAHYAHHLPGTFYELHVDRHFQTRTRVVSAVIYLNSAWPAAAGGEIVLFDAANTHLLTLSPRGGTLVLFMSEGTPHEALKATRERWSIAGWFRCREARAGSGAGTR